MPCGSHVTRFIRIEPLQGLTDRVSAGGRPAGGREPARRARRTGSWLGTALALVWIGVLLLVVAYLALKGEAAISEFDSLDLSAYSTSP
jgi:hypothetical protein